MSIHIDRRRRKPIGIGGNLLQYVSCAMTRNRYEPKFEYIDLTKPISIRIGGDEDYYWMDMKELEDILNEIDIQNTKIGDIDVVNYMWLKDLFDEEKNRK